jgi:L-fucose isomerase-like protein
MAATGQMTLGLIVGNRSFFPDALAREGRDNMIRLLESDGYKVICPPPELTKGGAVETLDDAQNCANLFRQHRDEIAGIIVTLPNFGDERNAANAIRLAELNVPVLVHAFPDEPDKMLMGGRRDSFCGKISVCNNLWQYGVKFSLTTLQTVWPESESFRADLRSFAATCRILRGLKYARVGVVGARPAAFNTVRFSEKLLERAGITVETLDLSEALGRIGRLGDDDQRVKSKLAQIDAYVSSRKVPSSSVLKMAKFGVVMDEWVHANKLVGTSIQCWTAMQEFFGVVPCTLMSMMSNNLLPSACETDMVGMIGMYILQLASSTPSSIVDWNNNYSDDPDKAVVFHCSNLPAHFFEDLRMDYNEIIAVSVGKEQAFGTVVGRLKSGPLTFCRVSTDDLRGQIRAYVGEGDLTADPLSSFGGYGVIHVSGLQKLMQFVCRNGFEHHVCISLSRCGRPVQEALERYLEWDLHVHQA